MSLDIYIKYKEPGPHNYFLEHPYYYEHLSEGDKLRYYEEEEWNGNITHNLGEMATHVPVTYKKDGGFKIRRTDLYHLLWRPEEVDEDFLNTDVMGKLLPRAIAYMLTHRLKLLKYESPNGWGTFNGFMKFLLNLLQACQDNPNCKIEVSR